MEAALSRVSGEELQVEAKQEQSRNAVPGIQFTGLWSVLPDMMHLQVMYEHVQGDGRSVQKSYANNIWQVKFHLLMWKNSAV